MGCSRQVSAGQAGLGAEGLLSACGYLHSINVCCRKFCSTAPGILASHPFKEGGSCPDHLIHSLSSVSLRCLRTQERQADGNRVKGAGGRAESCSPCPLPGTRRERPAGCWAEEGEDLHISAGTGLWVSDNCLVGEKEVREEAWGPGLCCSARRSQVVHILLSTRACHLPPAGYTVPHPVLHAKMPLDSFSPNFADRWVAS